MGHGELDINIHSGTPCVCAIPRKEKISVKDKVIRCPQPLSDRKPGTCSEKLPTPSSSSTDEYVEGRASVKVRKEDQAQANRELNEAISRAKEMVSQKYGREG